MRIIKISKGNGKFRTIYVPGDSEKILLSSMCGNLEKKAAKLTPENVSHGFSRGKSPVTNALAHVGHLYTTCFDLENFFDSVNLNHLKGKLSEDELKLVLVEGAPRQGLPTSPAVANIAASAMDHAILKWRDKTKLQFIYTRYADDLTFSYDEKTVGDALLVELPKIVGRCGFKLNKNKTRTQYSKGGRRIITGIGVDDEGIYPTRSIKRRMRAAKHQGNTRIYFGLKEWSKLKKPKIKKKEVALTGVSNELKSLANLWKLTLPKVLPEKETKKLTENILISGDHAYMLGMSTYTTGWTSCMAQPGGAYRKGVIFWCALKGTRVGMYLSDKTKTFGGVERRVMKARCLVHELRNGKFVYDRIYGNPQDAIHLKEILEKSHIISVQKARSLYNGERVKGHVPNKFKPYFDNLKCSNGKASEGPWKGKLVRVAHL